MTGDGHTVMYRRPRFTRKASSPLRLTGDDIAIVRAVAHHRFLRSTHLVRLLPHRSARKTIERLTGLYHAGFLDRPRAQINYFASTGSAPIVYALGNKGAEIVAEIEHAPPPLTDWTDKNRAVKRPYIEHALLLADLMLPLEVGSRDKSAVEFVGGDALLAALPTGTKRHDTPWTMTARLAQGGRRAAISVVPDAVFALHFKESNRRSFFFVEADRATMPIARNDVSQSSFRRKLLSYLAAHNEKQHAERFGFPNLRVLTLTTSSERVASMLDAVREITGGRGSGMFLFTHARMLATNPDPFTTPWQTTSGFVRIDDPPRLQIRGN
ncbi:MAG: replication-relaxation family protein [Hyphomicrobiaceae bacterium]